MKQLILWLQTHPRRSVFGLLAILLALAAVRQQSRAVLPPIDELFRGGELRFAVDASNPPFASTNENGELAGLEIDIAHAVAAEIGLPARLIPHGYDGLYDALKTGQVDAVIAALSVDPARLNEVNYSQPYFDAGLMLVSGAGIASMAALPGRTLAVEYGSEADAEARRWLRRVAAFEIQRHSTANAALTAVWAGTTDAALVDTVTLRLYQQNNRTWSTTITRVTSRPYAIVTRAGEPAMSVYIDRALVTLQENGALAAILDDWLGSYKAAVIPVQ